MSSTALSRLALLALLAAGPALAQQPAQPAPAAPAAEPALPTVEQILRQAQPAQARPRPAEPAPAMPSNLPTLGDLAASATQRPAAPAISCEPPERPAAPPDGAKASEEEMRKAEAVFRAYVKDGQAFQSCLERAQREAFRQLTVNEFLTLENILLQMQASMQQEAERFNAELRRFRAKK